MSNKTTTSPSVDLGYCEEMKPGVNNKETAMLNRLAKSISEGDESAWAELYLLFYDSVKVFINRFVRSPEEAADITQDVFVSLWENTPKIDPSRNIRGYIYTIAKGLSYKHLRQRVRNSTHSMEDGAPEAFLADIAPDNLLEADELQLVVSIALESMPQQRRTVFKMSRYEGKGNDEIAQELGLSKRTVENHLYIVKQDLKKLIYLAIAFAGMHNGIY